MRESRFFGEWELGGKKIKRREEEEEEVKVGVMMKAIDVFLC